MNLFPLECSIWSKENKMAYFMSKLLSQKLYSYFRLYIIFVFMFMSCQILAYEETPAVYLADILPSELIQSLKHRVENVEVRQGIFHFYLESDFGNYNIKSMGLLRERVREIIILGNAINRFVKQADDRPNQVVGGPLVIRADRALDIIKQPVSSATNLARQVVDNLNETLAGPMPEAQRAFIYRGGKSIDPVTVLHKRNVASQWLLDVYSTNPKVQEFLNAVARARSSGNIAAGTPSLNRQRVQPLKVRNSVLDTEIYFLLKANSVIELNDINEQLLAGLNIEQELRMKFLQHPVYSPRHKTRISHYLNQLGDVANLSVFIDAAIRIQDESKALSFEHLVMMLLYYHQNRNHLRELQLGKTEVHAITDNNQLIYFVVQDLIYWNESAESLYEEILKQAKNANHKQWNVITSGSITKEARIQLQKRQYGLQEQYIF